MRVFSIEKCLVFGFVLGSVVTCAQAGNDILYKRPVKLVIEDGQIVGLWQCAKGAVPEETRLSVAGPAVRNRLSRFALESSQEKSVVLPFQRPMEAWGIEGPVLWVLLRSESNVRKKHRFSLVSYSCDKKEIAARIQALPITKSGGEEYINLVPEVNPPLYYDIELTQGIPKLWIAYNRWLTVWQHVPEEQARPPSAPKAKKPTEWGTIPGDEIYGVPDWAHGWKRCGMYMKETRWKSIQVLRTSPALILDSGGAIYSIENNRAVVRIGGVNEDIATRCVLLHDQESKAYAVFSWDGRTAKPLDVQDKEKKNIASFTPAKDVETEVTKAVAVMMTQRDKDEKEVLELGKKQEAERKKKLAEEAKKPRPMTLQERLQQNERGK